MSEWKSYLSSLGFSESEIVVYLTSLRNGPMSVLELARKTGVSRVTVYHVIESLVKQGLMTSVQRGAKQNFAAEPPEQILALANARLEKMKQTVSDMKDRVKDLHAIQNTNHPIVKLYEGEDAIRAMYTDILSSKEREFKEFGNYDAGDDIFVDPSLFKPFITKMNKKKIRRKMMFLSKKATPKGNSALEEVKLLPKDLDFNGDVIVYGNKIVLWSTEDKPVVVIIESKSIAKTVEAMFDMIWGNKKAG